VGVGLRAITYYNDALIRTDVCYEQLAQYSGKIKSKSDRIEREELQDLAIKHGSKNDLIVPWWKRVRNDRVTQNNEQCFPLPSPSVA
jgi:hypothetical protein